MWFWVVTMDNGDVGTDVVPFGPYEDLPSARADEDAVYAWVKDKGYREEYDDYRADLVRTLPPEELRKRYPRGRFASE